MIPGEYLLEEGEIALNAGRRTATMVVANAGDRPIQVGSHYHFYEVNDALQFEREATRGGDPDPQSGKAAGADIDQDPPGATAIRQRGDHRHQSFGMPAPDHLMRMRDHDAILDQRDRAGGGRGVDDERTHAIRRSG